MFLSTAKNILSILGIIFIFVLIFARFFSHGRSWNKDTGIDAKQSFTTAYLTMEDNKIQKFKVDTWRDFDNGDQLQFTTPEGITYLTHASRVVLTDEQ